MVQINGRSLTQIIAPHHVEQMRAMLPAQTNDMLSQTFGIGFHTWVKIKSGTPIRASVASRIRTHLGKHDFTHSTKGEQP